MPGDKRARNTRDSMRDLTAADLIGNKQANRIRRLRKQGYKVTQIAKEVKCSERAVRRLIEEDARKAKEQRQYEAAMEFVRRCPMNSQTINSTETKPQPRMPSGSSTTPTGA